MDFINGLNADWVGSSKRLSPRILTDWIATSTTELATFFEGLPSDRARPLRCVVGRRGDV